MVTTSNVPYFDGLGEYVKYGYVPLEATSTAASTTLEYCYDDWTIYKTALAAGNTEVAEQYKQRALNYRNIYDAEIGYARPKYRDGSFKKEFDVLQTHGEGFIEGNSWNFSFHVPHDVFGVIRQMGGEKEFVRKLDELFGMHLPEEYYEANEDITADCLIGGYVHGNEPSHHIIYLYSMLGQPHKTAERVREVMTTQYRNNFDGLSGNEDMGQMSAWYLMSALGFYQVEPAGARYWFGSPTVDRAELTVKGGNFVIETINNSATNIYIKSITLNGKPHNLPYIEHSDIAAGGTLTIEMSDTPTKWW